MRSMWRRAPGALACGTAIVLLATGDVQAGDDAVLKQMMERLDKLEKQNEELRQKLKEGGPINPYAPIDKEKEKVNKMIDSYLKDKEKKDKEKKKIEEVIKEKEKEEKGYEVGTDTALKARWNLDQGLIFETANRDFWTHIGFYCQWDTVAFTQTPTLRAANQLGDLQDGTFFRRIRPQWDGQAWGFVEWNVILALEQISADGTNTNGLINLDECWMGVYGVPILGRIRAGHLKVCQGLEGNQWSSSRAMTFQENAAYTDAFYNIFATGVQLCNSALDDRITWQGMVYRDDNPRDNVGADFGDGAYGATGRITGLLIDECEDHHILHLGLSGTWRKAEKADATLGLTGPDQVRLRARPELRDAFGGFGDGATLPGNSGRLVDTGTLTALSTGVVGTELFYILGPFSVMAEWATCTVNSAVVPFRGRNVIGDRNFNGGYVTVSYFLTGETRLYDKVFGREGTFYVERPFTNAFAKWDEDGGLALGWGAWEVAARFSYLNLNDGPVQGGVMDGVTLGLNWYLASNLKVQFEYLHNARWNKASGSNGNLPGTVDGFGSRVQFQY
jgi:phosphate-selective porin OprO/OprP